MSRLSAEEQERLVAIAEQRLFARGHAWEGWRRSVFEELLASEKALSAYDLLHRVADRLSKKVVPPQIYRALEMLVQEGLVHRIASQNLYVVCSEPSSAHTPLLMICERCNGCFESRATHIDRFVRKSTGENGFAVSQVIVEAVGVCTACSGKLPSSVAIESG